MYINDIHYFNSDEDYVSYLEDSSSLHRSILHDRSHYHNKGLILLKRAYKLGSHVAAHYIDIYYSYEIDKENIVSENAEEYWSFI